MKEVYYVLEHKRSEDLSILSSVKLQELGDNSYNIVFSGTEEECKEYVLANEVEYPAF